jgi:hypothetical protein
MCGRRAVFGQLHRAESFLDSILGVKNVCGPTKHCNPGRIEGRERGEQTRVTIVSEEATIDTKIYPQSILNDP